MDRWRRERMEQEEALRMCKMNDGGANSKEKQGKERKMGNEGKKEGPKTKGKQEEGKKMSMEGRKGIEEGKKSEDGEDADEVKFSRSAETMELGPMRILCILHMY